MGKRISVVLLACAVIFLGSSAVFGSGTTESLPEEGSSLTVPEDVSTSAPETEVTTPAAEEALPESGGTGEEPIVETPETALSEEGTTTPAVEETTPATEAATEVPGWLVGAWTDDAGNVYTLSEDDVGISDWGTSLSVAVESGAATFTVVESTDSSLILTISWLDTAVPSEEQLAFSFAEGAVSLVRTIDGTESYSGVLSPQSL